MTPQDKQPTIEDVLEKHGIDKPQSFMDKSYKGLYLDIKSAMQEWASLLPCPECAGKDKEIKFWEELYNKSSKDFIELSKELYQCKKDFDVMVGNDERQTQTISQLQKENERLKGLIEDELSRYWISNEYQDLVHSGHKAHTSSEISAARWQQFKIENDL